MSNKEALRDIVLYLDAVHGLYPGGVPEALIRADKDPETLEEGARARIVFITGVCPDAGADFVCPLSGTQGELLAAAITKGLKMDPAATRFLAVARDDASAGGQAAFERGKAIGAELKSLPASMAVIMGSRAASAFFAEPFEELRGSWRKIGEVPALVTHDLNDVLKSPAIKKEFWLDLQKIMPRK